MVPVTCTGLPRTVAFVPALVTLGEAVGRRHPGPAYPIDELRAIKVVDGSVEWPSQGGWTRFG